jgi:hypothetical protein
MNDLRAALDSNCLSYLLRATCGELTDNEAIFAEGVALIRLWLYVPGRFFITDTVAAECSEIPNAEKKALHSNFTSYTYWGVPIRNQATVDERAKEFSVFHRGTGDCKALAEAEDAELNVLLTYDRDFLKLKETFGSKVTLTKPSELWASLDIPRGAKPVSRPAYENPLEQQQWWLWR